MDFSKKSPREVEAYLRKSILGIFGDQTENASTVTASHGFYQVTVKIPGNNDVEYSFKNFRKKEASRVVKAMRALAAA